MAIADRINEMYTHVGDVYDTITNVDLPTNKNIQNIPQTIKDSYLEIMNNGIDTIWNNWEKVTGSGTSISLSPTLKAPMKNELKGNTSQTGTPTPSSPIPVNVVSGDNEINVCGKNLFDKTTLHTGDITGAYTTNRICDYQAKYLETGTYTFSSDLTSTYRYYITINDSGTRPMRSYPTYSYNSGWVNDTTKTFTITTPGYFTLTIARSDNGTITLNDIKDFNYQLEKGTQATNFEPYQGNTYNIDLGNCLPNTYTPVEYIETSGTQYIDTGYQATGRLKIEGRVYTEQTNTEMAICGVTYNATSQLEVGFSSTNNRFFNYSGGASSAVIPTESIYNKVFDFIAEVGDSLPRKKITLNLDNNISSTNDTNNGVYRGNTITLFTTNNGFFFKGRLYKLDIYDDNVLKRRLVPCYRNSDNVIGLYDIVGNTFYTNLGTGTFTKGNDVENGIELCKIGNYQDYFYKDSDKWYLHKEVGSKDFTSTNMTMHYLNVYDDYRRLMITKTTIGIPTGWVSGLALCNYFKEISGSTPISIGTFNTDKDSTNLLVYLPTTINTLAEAKTYMDSLANSKIYYVLETPTNTEITDTTLINQLEQFYQAQSKNNQTNISQINNDLGFIISASALKKG